MILQHWRTKGGKHEIQIEKVYASGMNPYYRASSITNGKVTGTSIRNTQHSILEAVNDLVRLAACIDGINYKCTFTQGEN